MRGTLAFLLLALGAFGIAMGLMLRFWVYPALAVVPLNQFTESVAVGRDMTVFYPSKLQERRGVEVTATRRVVGDVLAEEATLRGSVMVWDVGLVVEDADETLINLVQQRVCLDRTTNMTVEPCSSDHLDNKSDVRQAGLQYKFPFGTKQQDYPYFDTTVKDAPPMRFLAEEEVNGLETYKFAQGIPSTRVEDREVPGSLVDETASKVLAGRYYENVRTVWVEPYSGIIVKGEDNIRQTLRGPSGRDSVTLLQGTLSFTESTVSDSVRRASDARSKLILIRTYGPVGALSVGVIMIIAGGLLLWNGHRSVPAQHQRKVPQRDLAHAG